MYIQSYKQLEVWKRAVELVKEIYRITEKFPKSELYSLTTQMRLAAVSIPSNIAEGYKRQWIGEYLQFLSIADASAAELETQIIISKDLYLKVDFSKSESLLEEVQKMLVAINRKLNAKRSTLNAHTQNGGQIMLVTVLTLSGTMLAVTAIAALLMIYQARQSVDAVNSAKAIFAADAGLEFQLFKSFRSGQCAVASQSENGFDNGAAYAATCVQSAPKIVTIRSQGTAGNVARALRTILRFP